MTQTFSIPAMVARHPSDDRCLILTDANGSTVTHQFPNADCATMTFAVWQHNFPIGVNK